MVAGVEALVVNAVFVWRAVTLDSTLWSAWQPLVKKTILEVGTQALADTAPRFGKPQRKCSFHARVWITWIAIHLL